MAGAHNARVLRVAGQAEAEIDGLADALRRGAVELATARALAQGFVAARKRVAPDPAGLFAEDASRRLTRAFAEGLMARRPYEAEGLIADGILRGGGLTREEEHGLRVDAGRARRRAEARAALMLEEEIRRGRAGAAEVAAAVATGEIPAAAAAHLDGIAEATAAAEAQRQAGAARVAEVLVGRAPKGDPEDTSFRQALEAYAESLLPDILASLPPEATARIAAATGVVPARALLHVAAGLDAQAAPARRVAAILTVAMTDAQAPGVLDREAGRLRALPEAAAVAPTARDLAFARATAALVRHGIPPGEAARIAETRLAQAAPEPGAAQAAAQDATQGAQARPGDVQVQPVSVSAQAPGNGAAGADEAAPPLSPDAAAGAGDGATGPSAVLGGEGLTFTDADEAGAPAEHATPTLLDRVLDRIAEGAGPSFEGEIGISEETFRELQDAGLFRQGGSGPSESVRAFNEILMAGGAAAVDLALRALEAVEAGGIAGLGQVARELGEDDADARRLERDLAILATVAGRRGRTGRRSAKAPVARLAPTPGMTARQRRVFGNLSEEQRLAQLRPKNRFVGAGAFAVMTPEEAFHSTRWPPRGAPENVFRGLAAVDLLIENVLRRGKGIVRDAMRRSDLPPGQQSITFRWGDPGAGKDFTGGFGISHIIAKRGIEVLEDVIETIATGTVRAKFGPTGRLEIRRGKKVAILALDRDGNRETWVLTGYEERASTAQFDLSALHGPIFFTRR